ncbi:MAG: lasso peptide biosynthesis B2 protein [Actinobacteria bacterium]|nr:lasso peptide biosynthesis B2 protein [Actinomycetota bacterium]
MKLLRTLKRLKHPRDLWLFLRILILLILLPGQIRRQSLPDLLARLDPGVGPGPRDQILLEKTSGFIDSLLNYRFFRRYGRCLLRSLVLFRFLRGQGWPVEIHFGVRKTAEGMADITGHSWLVLDGEPFLEDESQRGSFATTMRYPE